LKQSVYSCCEVVGLGSQQAHIHIEVCSLSVLASPRGNSTNLESIWRTVDYQCLNVEMEQVRGCTLSLEVVRAELSTRRRIAALGGV